MFSIFETKINIRPDDIDLNNHVHYTKYLDYVLAARYEQMIKNYKMSINEFHDLGYYWVVSSTHIDYKRPLKLGDKIVIRTQISDIKGAQSRLNFWIVNMDNNKVAAEGYLIYTMILLKTGKPVRIPEFIIQRYSI